MRTVRRRGMMPGTCPRPVARRSGGQTRGVLLFPRPVAIGLSLCDNAIVERDTNKVSLVGQFQRLRYAQFPATAIPFWACATLSGGVGRGAVRLEILDLEDLSVIFALDRTVEFSDRLTVYHVLLRVVSCTFPRARWYNSQLLVDGELLAQRRLHVLPLN